MYILQFAVRSIKIGAHVLRWSDETRYLGVIIDKKTKF